MAPSGQTKGTGQGAGPQLLSEGGELRVTRQPSCQSKPKEVGDVQELADDSVDHRGKECYIRDHALTFRPDNKSLCMGFERKVTITFCDLGIFLRTPPLACKAALLLAAMTTPLEDAMDTLIRIFHHYSGKEGDRNKLSKGELKELLTSELTDFLSGQKDPLLVDKIMNDLDSNKDNEVDFNEFVILVAALTVACNDFFEEQLKKEEF
ncbi:protein S100-Z [Ammospiza nelsoni]|uniref:protein S100-Z n=1 Tax=Ammospiza caudacuta TaxID=2857398 RepID=UPI00273A09D7|nr:protein S100-Z [Ammospiza caudacuta]XP_059349069.1 protein S100-Z [Ammospiza nelsoni]